MRGDSTFNLFIQALNVTNAALEMNRESAALKPLMLACGFELSGDDFPVAIYEDDPDQPVDFFTIRMTDERFVLVSHGVPPDGESAWNVPKDYLRDVVDNPRKYLDNPALLALDWLKDRVGLA